MRSALGFLVDMDGVIYRGSELISGAKDFIERLLEEDVPFFMSLVRLRVSGIFVGQMNCKASVSYTHLTLPTNREV
mgnify:CR=1 FL=1